MSTTHITEAPSGYELRIVEPKDLVDNPDNVRGSSRDREGLAASIAQLGILNPPLAFEDADGRLVLIAGERRKHSAIKAGVTEMPVYVRSDLSPAAKVAGMLVENHHREGLTELETAVGIQRLAGMEGVTRKQVSELTGISQREVKRAIQVGSSATAVAVAERHGLTMDQALVLAEFEDDPEAVKMLTVVAVKRPYSFDHTAAQMRQQRADDAERATVAAALAAEGVSVVDLVDGWAVPDGAAWLSDLVAPKGRKTYTEAAHRSCAGHAAAIVQDYDGTSVRYLCTDTHGHGHDLVAPAHVEAEQPKGMTDEQRAERRRVIANNKAWPVASKVRQEFVASLVARATPPTGTLRYVVEVIASGRGGADFRDSRLTEMFGAAAGTHPWHRDAARAMVDGATDKRLALVLFGFVAAGMEQRYGDRTGWRINGAELVGYLRFLAGTGYGLSEVEQELVDADEGAEHAPAEDDAS